MRFVSGKELSSRLLGTIMGRANYCKSSRRNYGKLIEEVITVSCSIPWPNQCSECQKNSRWFKCKPNIAVARREAEEVQAGWQTKLLAIHREQSHSKLCLCMSSPCSLRHEQGVMHVNRWAVVSGGSVEYEVMRALANDEATELKDAAQHMCEQRRKSTSRLGGPEPADTAKKK